MRAEQRQKGQNYLLGLRRSGRRRKRLAGDDATHKRSRFQGQKGQNAKALPPESSGEQGQKGQNVRLCLRQRGGVHGVTLTQRASGFALIGSG